MSPQNGTPIYLSLTSAYYPMSVDNTDDELFSTREPIETTKPYSQTDAANSSSSSYTPRTSSTSTLYLSAALPSSLTPSSKSHNKTESMQEGV